MNTLHNHERTKYLEYYFVIYAPEYVIIAYVRTYLYSSHLIYAKNHVISAIKV